MASTKFLVALLLGVLATLTSARTVALPEDLLTRRTTLLGCLASANVTFSLPSNSTWSLDSQVWNSRIAPVPAPVVYPSTEDQVSAAIQGAASTNTKVTTLGGNRSFASMGFGRNDDATIINLKSMEVLEYDSDARALTYGGPVTISNAARFLWDGYGRTLMHGRCPDVGMSGVGLGGGFGTLSRTHVTILDTIVAVRIALANGTIVDASTLVNEDVFLTVRGAASSVGSVLTTTIETFWIPSERVVSYTMGFPAGTNITIDDNAAALVGMQDWAQSNDNFDNLSVPFGIKKNSSLAGFYYGKLSEFDTVSASLLKHLPKMAALEWEEVDFWASENLTTPGIAEGSITERRYFYIDSIAVPVSHPLTLETARSPFNSTAFALQPTDATASGFVDLWGGAFAQTVAPDASAWKHDDNLLLVRWDLRTKAANASFSPETLQSVKSNFCEFISAYETEGGVPGGFPNYWDAEWTIEETAKYLYGGNWERLLKLKKALEAEGLFNTGPQAVPV